MDASGGGCRVLHVEDHDDLAKVMVMVLESEGFEVTHVPDYGSATERLAEGSYDIILLDLSMGSGFSDFVRRLNGMESPPPILLFSGRTAAELREFSRLLGADYVQKPADMDVVVGAIRRVLGSVGQGAGPVQV